MTKNGAGRASACQHPLYQNRRHRKAEGSRSGLVGLILLGVWDTHESAHNAPGLSFTRTSP
jgi:hypothetical protein